MKIIQPWDCGDLTTDKYDDYIEFFSKLDKNLQVITLRPLSAEPLLKIKPNIIPMTVSLIKLVNLVAENRSSESQIISVLTDIECTHFIQNMTGFEVALIQGVRQRPLPPEKIVYQISISHQHYFLDALEEKAKNSLSDYISIGQGFTLDSPMNTDREFGVYDSLEIKLKSPLSQNIYTFVLDRFGYKFLVTTASTDSISADDMNWITTNARLITKTLLIEPAN